MELSILVNDKDGNIRASNTNIDEVVLVFNGEYNEGDVIALSCSESNAFVVVHLDDAMESALCYMTGGSAKLIIPFAEKKVSYSPLCFTGDRHYLSARKATLDEVNVRRNLAFNPYDSHENTSLFPHVSANVETRGESVFAARNAIDGFVADNFHGEWPYSSWGINKNPDATLRLDFGRPVLINEIVLYLRADFPHDAWWTQATVSFSNDSNKSVIDDEIILSLEKKSGAQHFTFNTDKNTTTDLSSSPRIATSLTLKRLIKADDPSPFPALTQIQVFGVETLAVKNQ